MLAGSIVLIAVFQFFTFSTDEAKEDAEYQKLFNKNYSIFALNIPDNLTFSGEEVPVEDFDIKERLDRELLINTYFQSSSLLLYKRANRWFPVIEPILKKYNIPDDFKYLPLVESNLTNAVSPKGATGYWQLMERTAKTFGLEVNDEIDERYHMEKSAEAACKYLQRAHRIFNNWTLAAASYNIGIDGIKRQLEKQRTSNYYDLLLNQETSRYIFRILAIKEILVHPQNYGFHFRKKDLYPPVPIRVLTIDSSIVNLAEFAIQHNINYKILKIMNPWLRKNSLTNKERKTYYIKIPKVGYSTYGSYTNASTPFEKLNWIIGTWTGEGNGGTMYETWTKFSNQLIIGESYSILNEDTVFSETMRIEQLDSSIFYIVKVSHNKSEILFKLIDAGNNKVIFENLEHDFPTRIIYIKKDSDTLHARIEGTSEGEAKSQDFIMTRVE